MSFTTQVRDAIHQKFIYEAPGGLLRLIEEKNLNPKTPEEREILCREVYIKLGTLDNPPIILRIDLEEPGLKLHPLLKDAQEKGINRRCDYIIICQHANKIYIVVAELKSQNEGKWRQQCVIGESLIHYIMSAIDRIGGKNYRASFEYRHVLFTTDSTIVHKRPTGNNPIKYLYNSYLQSYFSIQRCNNPNYLPYHLVSFLSDTKSS